MIGAVGMSNPYMRSITKLNYTNPVNMRNVTEDAEKVQSGECQTCKNRKYKDGSDEMVSFKTPGHISPEESFSKVMGHEKEHVSNAVAEGRKENKELVSVSVSLQTAVCPECGESYVSGGTTNTVMKTYKDDPYSQNRKSYEQEALKGKHIDYVA